MLSRNKSLTLFLLLSATAWSSTAADEKTGYSASEAAAEFLSLAGEMLDEGHLIQAKRALGIGFQLDPGKEMAKTIEKKLDSRIGVIPLPSAPVDAADRTIPLYNGKSFKGWKKVKGKWEALALGIQSDSEKSECIILSSSGAKTDRGFSLSVEFRIEKGGTAGIVLGRSGKNRIGVIFGEEGAALYDFKKDCAIGPFSKKRFPSKRSFSVTARVHGSGLTVLLGGKPFLLDRIDNFEPADPGLYARGRVLFKQPLLTRIETDILVERALAAQKKREPARAAAFLLRARAADENALHPLGLLAVVFEKLNCRDRAARYACEFLDLLGEGRPDGPELKKLQRTAAAIAERGEEARKRIDECAKAWTERVIFAGNTALREKQTAKARSILEALEALESRGELVEDFRARLVLAERGIEGEITLFDGKDLAGWTQRGRKWFVEKGVLNTDPGPDLAWIESPPFPLFHRYLLKTRQKGSGSYIDQGIRFFINDETWDLSLFRFMKKQEIKILRNGQPVFFRTGNLLSSAEWIDLDCLVHGNRLTVILNGESIFTKVLPAPPEGKAAFFVSAGRKGSFGRTAIQPIGRLGEYESLIARFGVPALEVVECEILKSGESTVKGRLRKQPFAYNGLALIGAFECGRALPFRFNTLAMEKAVLSLRYSLPGAKASPDNGMTSAPATTSDTPPRAVSLAVAVDGRRLDKPLELHPTGSVQDFTYTSTEIGLLPWGWHSIHLEAIEAFPGRLIMGNRILLDRLVLSEEKDAPIEETKLLDSDAAPHFRIRLSPGVSLPGDQEEIFGILEVIRGYLVEHYGFEPVDPLYFNFISRECWADPHKGGYATGDNLFVPEEVAIRNIATLMHELSHNFDRGVGFNPPWFGEGKSFPLYLRFTKETRGRYRSRQTPISKDAVINGEAAFDKLVQGKENLLQHWGTEKFPYWGKLPDGRDLTSLGYSSSNWFCYKLSGFLGETWILDYFTLLRKEMEDNTYFMPRDRIEANSVIADYFTRSSGRDATAFFREKRFTMIDIYDWETITVDCGEGEKGGEKYLTDTGGSSVEPAVSGNGKCRSVTEGSFTYAFPVSPDTEEILVEITRSGYGRCDAWGKRLFRGKAPGIEETRKFRLKDSALWAGSRLRLEFTSEKIGDRTLKVDRIVLTK